MLKSICMNHEKNMALINMLNDCAIACSQCAIACLNEENIRMMVPCIKLNIDCADICHLTASLLSRDSEQSHYLLAECGEVCKKCADECEKHRDMEHCEICAEACYKCAMYVGEMSLI
jgi:hypothetical protein